jgi:hypothetical protein
LLWIESLAVQKYFRIELSWSPTQQDRSHCRLIDTKQIGNRLKVRAQIHDRADVEIAVGPTVEALADSGSKRVVYCRVTKSARDAYGLKSSSRIEGAFHSDNCIEFE